MEATSTLFSGARRLQRKVLYTVTLSYPWVLHAGIHEVWIKWNTLIMLVGMQTRTATVENTVEIP